MDVKYLDSSAYPIGTLMSSCYGRPVTEAVVFEEGSVGASNALKYKITVMVRSQHCYPTRKWMLGTSKVFNHLKAPVMGEL